MVGIYFVVLFSILYLHDFSHLTSTQDNEYHESLLFTISTHSTLALNSVIFPYTVSPVYLLPLGWGHGQVPVASPKSPVFSVVLLRDRLVQMLLDHKDHSWPIYRKNSPSRACIFFDVTEWNRILFSIQKELVKLYLIIKLECNKFSFLIFCIIKYWM